MQLSRIPAPDTGSTEDTSRDSDPRGEYYDDDDYDYDRHNDSDSDGGYYTTAWGTREIKDYAACDKECGYCGTCEY